LNDIKFEIVVIKAWGLEGNQVQQLNSCWTHIGDSDKEAIDLFHGIYKDGLEALQQGFLG